MPNATIDPGTILERTDLTAADRQTLLATEPRRQVVAVLSTHGAPIGLENLARTVAERDSVAGDETELDALAERTAIDLHHTALPHLDDAGLVEYDADANQVRSVAVGESATPTP